MKHDNACILKQIEESNMKRLPDIGVGYGLSYFFCTINALISGTLTLDRALAKIMAPFLRATRRASEAMPSKCAPFGFFSEFLAAMHESRRCQAAREIRRFEHLVPEARAYEARARQAHQPCTVPEDRAVTCPAVVACHARLGRPGLRFRLTRIAKPSARQIGGKQSS
jgi:hypothetical protein